MIAHASDGAAARAARFTAGTDRWTDIIHAGLIGAVITVVFGPSMNLPLRLWDHHAILLLAKAPQFAHGLFWHLVHFRGGSPNEDAIYFRVLSMPTVWTIAKLFQDSSVSYYALHLTAHWLVVLVFYVLATELGGNRTVSALMAVLFAIFGGHGDTATIPYYTFMLLSMLLAGVGALHFVRHLARGDQRSLVVAVACVALATLFYDSFLLLAVSLPILAGLIAARRGRPDVLRTAGWLLGSVVALLVLVVLSLKFSPTTTLVRGAEIQGSLRATLVEVLGEKRLLWAVGYGVWGVLTDVQLFLTGHSVGLWHRGNLPYWDPLGLESAWLRVHLALALMMVAFGWVWFVPRRWAAGALIPLGLGLYVDARSLPLAVLFGLVLVTGWREVVDRRVVFIWGAALVVSVNVAMGRADGYNLVAFRHHYLTAFFVLAGLAQVVSRVWSGRERWARHAVIAAVVACIIMNAWLTLSVLAGVKNDNEMVWSFDRALGVIADQQGPRSLFVGFSTSRVRGHDWHGFPAQDIVFDLLHYHRDPMTRYVNRAPWLVREDGVVRPNPLGGQAADDDFLVGFTLLRFPSGRHEVFGSSPLEPRVVLDDDGLALIGRRKTDAAPIEWRFHWPPAILLPAAISLARQGDSLQVRINGRATGTASVAGADAYHGWESDNVGLLGPGWERLMISLYIFDTYLRIGRGIGAEL